MEKKYQFPVKNIYEAISVTQQDFNIAEFIDQLYVTLDAVRSPEQLDRLKFYLGITKNELTTTSEGAQKILFYGHTGTGKSTELRRLNSMVNQPDLYFVVFASVESDMDVYNFEREDLFVLLITKLVRELESRKIKFDKKLLNELAQEWLSEDQEILKELQENFEFTIESEASVGFDFWKFLAAKTGLKDVFSTNSKTTQTIRTKIKTNPTHLILRLNRIFNDLRRQIQKQGKGKDILFIIDGTEKLRGEKYDTFLDTFIRGAQLILDIKINMILSVPIDARYDMQVYAGSTLYPQEYFLPMVEITGDTKNIFREIVTKRVDADTFFEPKALDLCIEQSGGNPRQLLRIVNLCLQNTLGLDKVTVTNAANSIQSLGLQLLRMLKSEHIEVLRSGEFESADEPILQLLFTTAIMEYNGTGRKRKINPLLEPLIKPN